MTVDLGTQIRDYAHTVDAAQEPLGIDDLMVDYLRQRPDASDTPANQKGWSGVVAAVAATILVVVGVVVVADGNGGDVVSGPASSPSVSVPAAPPAVADPVPPVWPLVFRDRAGGSNMSGVVAGGPGFVAVGGRDGNAAVWTSVDGLTWSRVPHDEVAFGKGYISAVTAGGPGLVAVGSAGGDPEVDRRGPAVVWTSADGLAWSRVPHDEAAFGEAEMGSVTVGGPGLVAVGVVGADFFRNDDAAVWTSVDGLAWSRVAHDETLFGGADNQSMNSVTAGGPGLVAVGRDGPRLWDNSPGQDAAVWTSVDGLTWSRVPHDEDAFGRGGPAMLGVTTGGPGLVAVGHSFTNSAAVWTSVDGLAWSRVAHDNGVDLSGSMRSVTAGGPGLVAVGSVGDAEGRDAAVWTSVDGITWSRAANGVEAEPGTHLNMLDVSAANGRLVAVGNHDFDAAAVWTSPNP